MHRSRLVGILIDTPAAQAGAAVDFWSAALGVAARPAPGEEQFTVLSGAVPGLFAVIQSVEDAPRYHLDIETDDLNRFGRVRDARDKELRDPDDVFIHAEERRRELAQQRRKQPKAVKRAG